jgi:hypothetical protein
MLDYFVLFVSEQGPCYWQLVLDECCLGVQKAKKQSASIELRTCNNILTLAQPLHQKAPSFFGEKKIFTLSWKENLKPVPAPAVPSTG